MNLSFQSKPITRKDVRDITSTIRLLLLQQDLEIPVATPDDPLENVFAELAEFSSLHIQPDRPVTRRKVRLVRKKTLRALTVSIAVHIASMGYLRKWYNESLNDVYHSLADALQKAGYRVESGDPEFDGYPNWYEWLKPRRSNHQLLFGHSLPDGQTKQDE